MPLPLKSDSVCLPNNRQFAVKRWNQLNARFKKNPKFFADYQTFMKDIILQCAEEVPVNRLEDQDGIVNYVPHTCVYNPKKPGQIRVVFDCSAQFKGVSFSDYLLQGPDLYERSVGYLVSSSQGKRCIYDGRQEHVLSLRGCRRRQGSVTFSLVVGWGSTKGGNRLYRMKVHLLGASSSQVARILGLGEQLTMAKKRLVQMLRRSYARTST